MLQRRRLLNVALGIHIFVVVMAFSMPSTLMPLEIYMNITFILVGISAVLAFLCTYKILPSSPVFIFAVGSIFPMMGVFMVLLLRERFDKISKEDI